MENSRAEFDLIHAGEGHPFRVGPYAVERKLGRGGMATVVLGRRDEHSRALALKIIRGIGLVDRQHTLRFFREIHALKRLSHRHLVRILDAGFDGEWIYYALEYMPGGTLRDVLMERPVMEEVEAFAMIRPVAEAIAYLHRKKVVHRDLKPSNILLDGDRVPKVSDLGLLHIMEDTDLTHSGQVMGTIRYMSPEMLDEEPISFSSDVYQLGLVFFEIVTGRPFILPDSPHRMVGRILHGSMPTVRELCPSASADLEAFVSRCLSRNPRERPCDGSQFLEELDRVIRGDAIDPPPSVAPRDREPEPEGIIFIEPGEEPEVSTAVAGGGREAPSPVRPVAPGVEAGSGSGAVPGRSADELQGRALAVPTGGGEAWIEPGSPAPAPEASIPPEDSRESDASEPVGPRPVDREVGPDPAVSAVQPDRAPVAAASSPVDPPGSGGLQDGAPEDGPSPGAAGSEDRTIHPASGADAEPAARSSAPSRLSGPCRALIPPEDPPGSGGTLAVLSRRSGNTPLPATPAVSPVPVVRPHVWISLGLGLLMGATLASLGVREAPPAQTAAGVVGTRVLPGPAGPVIELRGRRPLAGPARLAHRFLDRRETEEFWSGEPAVRPSGEEHPAAPIELPETARFRLRIAVPEGSALAMFRIEIAGHPSGSWHVQPIEETSITTDGMSPDGSVLPESPPPLTAPPTPPLEAAPPGTGAGTGPASAPPSNPPSHAPEPGNVSPAESLSEPGLHTRSAQDPTSSSGASVESLSEPGLHTGSAQDPTSSSRASVESLSVPGLHTRWTVPAPPGLRGFVGDVRRDSGRYLGLWTDAQVLVHDAATGHRLLAIDRKHSGPRAASFQALLRAEHLVVGQHHEVQIDDLERSRTTRHFLGPDSPTADRIVMDLLLPWLVTSHVELPGTTRYRIQSTTDLRTAWQGRVPGTILAWVQAEESRFWVLELGTSGSPTGRPALWFSLLDAPSQTLIQRRLLTGNFDAGAETTPAVTVIGDTYAGVLLPGRLLAADLATRMPGLETVSTASPRTHGLAVDGARLVVWPRQPNREASLHTIGESGPAILADAGSWSRPSGDRILVLDGRRLFVYSARGARIAGTFELPEPRSLPDGGPALQVLGTDRLLLAHDDRLSLLDVP